MANELEDFNSSLGDSSKQLKTFQDVLAKNVNSTTILDGAFKTSAQAARDAERAQQKMAKSISGTISGLTSFSKSLIDGKGSFSPLSSVINLTTKALGGLLGKIPIVGKALKGVAEGAGQVANFMVEQFDKAYGTFEKLSESGVVTTFEDMKTSARSMGLTMADQEVLLSKRSKDLALFAGSAVRGREEFQKMSVASGDTREQFQRLGVSNQDFADMQLGYLNREMMAGRGQKATTDQLAKGSADYIKQLDAISKLTGASRKEIQSEREARMSEAQYRAGVASLPQKIRDEVDTVMDMMSKSGAKALATDFGNLVASAGKATSASQREMLATYGSVGLDLSALSQQVRSGAVSGEKATMMIADAAKLVDEKFREQKSVLGEQFALNKRSVENNNLSLRAGKDQEQINKDIAAEQARIMADENSEGAKLARTKQALYNSTVNLEQMATEGKLVTGSMKLMAEGIETITEKLYEMTGKDLPPYLKAKKDERTAIEKVKKTEEELARLEADVAEAAGEDAVTMAFSGAQLGDATMNNMKKVDAKRKELEDAIREKELAEEKRKEEDKKAGITDTSGPTTLSGSGGGGQRQPPGAGEMRSSPDMSGGKPQLATITSKEGKSTQVNKKAAPQFQKLLDWFGQAGYAINSLGGYNDRNIAGTNTPSWHSNGEAIDINPSKNPYGSKLITDMPSGTGQAAASLGLGWGANWPNIKDAMHFSTGPNEGGRLQARTGGIFSGPESGYLATLHGDEAVVDVSDESGVSQRPLNSSVLGNTSNNNVDFEEVYRDMENKLDKLIDLMDMNLGNQRKQLKEKMG